MNPAGQIKTELECTEHDEDVCVVYACESGSRAWGFESRDSDYDVRFLYVHRAAWYLSIVPGGDVIEHSVGNQLDFSGWDLRKALHLLRKSNPPLLEWLQSPVVYREIPAIVSQIRDLVPEYYSPAACHYHYLHMAQGNYREYLQGEEVWLKKYFYVLRPVLGCLWIEKGYGIVPMEFSALVEGLVNDPALRRAIDDLLQRKKAGEELERGPRIATISDFLDREITRLSARRDLPSAHTSIDALDRLFRFSIVEAYGGSIEQPAPADAGDRAAEP